MRRDRTAGWTRTPPRGARTWASAWRAASRRSAPRRASRPSRSSGRRSEGLPQRAEDRVELLHDVAHALRPLARVTLERAADERGERLGDRGELRLDRRRVLVEDLLDELAVAARLERERA